MKAIQISKDGKPLCPDCGSELVGYIREEYAHVLLIFEEDEGYISYSNENSAWLEESELIEVYCEECAWVGIPGTMKIQHPSGDIV